VREHPYSGEQAVATKAHLTFVALDENKEPVAVAPIEPETEEEKRRYANAQLRVKTRKELLKKMK
jgi:acyl-CoA hydrolase